MGLHGAGMEVTGWEGTGGAAQGEGRSGAKYSLLAYTTLGLESAEDSFRTHNLTITGNEESSFWLPLYGNMCCRLVAQPSCMARDMMAGFLNQQLSKQEGESRVLNGLRATRQECHIVGSGLIMELKCIYECCSENYFENIEILDKSL
ncbi:hypothetical protein CIB84_005486 [Bambusicola thoracicus]|uniref:Uncharacterized protein n=1 Tax=Bambusicola thoracicus TaxID=9083 RepID=A0A2P4T337_BAMTH|nr:hypothetical protein CIB84_005486 [Bambusicola thoracicus]